VEAIVTNPFFPSDGMDTRDEKAHGHSRWALAFIFSWNNFIFAIVLAGPRLQTLPVAVFGMMRFEQTNWGPLAAAALLITAPVLILTLTLQRDIVAGLAAGGMKG
jgi:multiple sugar transport system permease protein